MLLDKVFNTGIQHGLGEDSILGGIRRVLVRREGAEGGHHGSPPPVTQARAPKWGGSKPGAPGWPQGETLASRTSAEPSMRVDTGSGPCSATALPASSALQFLSDFLIKARGRAPLTADPGQLPRGRRELQTLCVSQPWPGSVPGSQCTAEPQTLTFIGLQGRGSHCPTSGHIGASIKVTRASTGLGIQHAEAGAAGTVALEVTSSTSGAALLPWTGRSPSQCQ